MFRWLFGLLFGRTKRKQRREPTLGALPPQPPRRSSERKSNPFAISLEEIPPEERALFERIPRRPPRKPGEPRRRRRTREEIDQDEEIFCAKMREKNRGLSAREKRQQTGIGITHYIWRSCGDGDECVACRRNNGKKFHWDRPPATGHPGECTTCDNGYCRCYAEPVIRD